MLQDSNLHRPIGDMQFTVMVAVAGHSETSVYICTKQSTPHNTPIFISQIETFYVLITEIAGPSETYVRTYVRTCVCVCVYVCVCVVSVYVCACVRVYTHTHTHTHTHTKQHAPHNTPIFISQIVTFYLPL